MRKFRFSCGEWRRWDNSWLLGVAATAHRLPLKKRLGWADTYLVGDTTSKQKRRSMSSQCFTVHSLRSSTTTVGLSWGCPNVNQSLVMFWAVLLHEIDLQASNKMLWFIWTVRLSSVYSVIITEKDNFWQLQPHIYFWYQYIFIGSKWQLNPYPTEQPSCPLDQPSLFLKQHCNNL